MADNDNSKKTPNTREKPLNAISDLVNNNNAGIRGVSDQALSEVQDLPRRQAAFETRPDILAMRDQAADIIAQYGASSQEAFNAAGEIVAKKSMHIAGEYRDVVNRLETVSGTSNIKKSVATLARSEKVKSSVYSEFGAEISEVNGKQTLVYGESAHVPSRVLEQQEQQRIESARQSGLSAKESISQVSANKLSLVDEATNQVRADVLGPASMHQSEMLGASAYRAGRQRQHEVGMSDMQRLKTNQEMQQEYLRKEESYAFKKDVRERVSSGSFDMDKAVSELRDAMKEAAKATKEWNEAAEAATKATDDNREALVKDAVDKSKIQAQKQQEADKKQAEVDLARRQGLDDPSRRIGGLQAFAGIGSIIANGLATSFIDQPIADIRQKAMMANKMVDRYQMGESALGGNMHALLQLQGIGASDDVARDMGRRQRLATGLDIAAEGVDAASKIKLAAVGGVGTAIKTVALGGDRELYARGVDAAQAIARTGNKITGAANKIQETDVQEQARNAADSLAAAKTAIPGKVLQRVYDQAMAAGDAVMGLGSGAQAEYAALTNQGNIDKMASFGVSKTQYAAYAGMAAQMVGGSESASQVAERAAEIQSKNIMSGQAFIQNAGTLANIGGKTSDLYEIMKTATAAGMDNSKNITQMVQATATLSEDLAQSGVSDTSSINSMLGGIVQQLVKSGVDKNMATPLAASAIQKQGAFFSSKDINYGNVAEAMMVQQALPTANDLQTAVISSLSPQELRTLAQRDKETGKPTNAASRLAEAKGIDDVFSQNLKAFEKGGAIQNAAIFGAESGMYGPGNLMVKTERDKRAARSYQGVGSNVDVAANLGKEAEQQNLKGQMTPAQEMDKVRAEREAEMLKSAGNFNEVLSGIVEQLKKVKEDLDPKKYQEKIEQSVLSKEMAETFSKSGENLKQGSEMLLNVSKKLEKSIDTISGFKEMQAAASLVSRGDAAGALRILAKMKPKQ